MKKLYVVFILATFLLVSTYASVSFASNVYQTEQLNITKWRSLKKGMTQQQVRQMLGEPNHIENDDSDSPTWNYYYGSYLYAGYVVFGTTGPLWNQQKRVLVGWEEPSY